MDIFRKMFIQGPKFSFSSLPHVPGRNKNHIFTETTVCCLFFSQPICDILHQANITMVTTNWAWCIICKHTKFTHSHVQQLSKLSLYGCKVSLVMRFIAKADTIVHKWMDGPNITCFRLITDTCKFSDFSQFFFWVKFTPFLIVVWIIFWCEIVLS